jgi:hypothetical protein
VRDRSGIKEEPMQIKVEFAQGLWYNDKVGRWLTMVNQGTVYSRPAMARALVAHFRAKGMSAITNVKADKFQLDVLAFDSSKVTLVAMQCLVGGQPSTLVRHYARANSLLLAVQSGQVRIHEMNEAEQNKDSQKFLEAIKSKRRLRFSVLVALMDKVCKRNMLRLCEGPEWREGFYGCSE